MSYNAMIEYMKLQKYTDDQIKRAIIFFDNKEYFEITNKLSNELLIETLKVNENISQETIKVNEQIIEKVVEYKQEEVKEIINPLDSKKSEIKDRLIDLSLEIKPQELKVIILNSNLSGKEIVNNLHLLKDITPSYKKELISTIDEITFKITGKVPVVIEKEINIPLNNKSDIKFVSNPTARELINEKAKETIYEFNHLDNVLNNIKNDKYTLQGLSNIKSNINNLKIKYSDESDKIKFLEVVEVNVYNNILKSMKNYNTDYKEIVNNSIENIILDKKIDIASIEATLKNFEEKHSNNKLSQNPILIPIIGVLINELLTAQIIQEKELKKQQELQQQELQQQELQQQELQQQKQQELDSKTNNKDIALVSTSLLIIKDVIDNKDTKYKELITYFKDSTYFDFKNLSDLIKSKDLSILNDLFDKKIDEGLEKKKPIEDTLLSYTAFGKISNMIDGLFDKEPGLDFIKDSLKKTLGDSLSGKEISDESDLNESLDNLTNDLINQLSILQDENPSIFANPNVADEVNKATIQLLETKLHNQLTELHNEELDKEIKSEELLEDIKIYELLKEAQKVEEINKKNIQQMNNIDMNRNQDVGELKQEILKKFGENDSNIFESIKNLDKNYKDSLNKETKEITFNEL